MTTVRQLQSPIERHPWYQEQYENADLDAFHYTLSFPDDTQRPILGQVPVEGYLIQAPEERWFIIDIECDIAYGINLKGLPTMNRKQVLQFLQSLADCEAEGFERGLCDGYKKAQKDALNWLNGK